MIDRNISGLDFRSHENLRPLRGGLNAFPESTYEESGLKRRINDLSTYRQLLKDAAVFEQHPLSDVEQQDLRDHMFYRVLSHSRFVNPAFLPAVERYQYHLYALLSLDFVNPMSFIKSAEKEMDGLDRNKTDDAARIAKLQEMVDVRKKSLSELKRRWESFAAELCRITLSIRDNLSGIERLCKTSIAILSDPVIGRTRERQLIEDIKTYFKEQLKDSLRRGSVSRQDVENAKEEFDVLCQEISAFGREDIHVLITAFEAVRGHTNKIAREIDRLLTEYESKKNGSVKENKDLFKRAEQTLVSLISDLRFELKAQKIRTGAATDDIVTAIRKEMLDYLFEAAQKERRSRSDRRSFKERRKSDGLRCKGSERRIGEDRRAVQNRRISMRPATCNPPAPARGSFTASSRDIALHANNFLQPAQGK